MKRQLLILVFLLVSSLCLQAQITFQKVLKCTFSTNSIGHACGVGQTSDGGYYISGHIIDTTGTEEDFYLIKTDSAGDPIWYKTYGKSGRDYAFAAIETSDNGFLLGGISVA